MEAFDTQRIFTDTNEIVQSQIRVWCMVCVQHINSDFFSSVTIETSVVLLEVVRKVCSYDWNVHKFQT